MHVQVYFRIKLLPREYVLIRTCAVRDLLEEIDRDDDQVAEVIVGVNRSTFFCCCKKGTFLPKHISGGWLRSDVEKWFAPKAVQVP